jgi:tetratricopeptide (TPR) repeat protein
VEELSEEAAEETKAIEEPSEPALQMFEAPPPPASGSRRVLFGILFFLIGLFIYLVWPQDGNEPADEAVPRTDAPDSKPTKKTKKRDARQPKEVKLSTVAKTEKKQAHSQAEEKTEEKAEKKAEEKAAQDIAEKAEAEEAPEASDQSDNTTTSSLSEVKSVGEVKELIRDGKREAAIQGLQKLRREQPRNAQIVFLLANLYSEKNWWSDALEHYREAIRLDGSYRKRSALIRNIIQMLSAEKLGKKAMYTLIKTVGRPALPQLRRALKREKNPTAKRRISATIRKLGGR